MPPDAQSFTHFARNTLRCQVRNMLRMTDDTEADEAPIEIPPLTKLVADNVRKRREHLGISEKKFYVDAKISRSSVRNFEKPKARRAKPSQGMGVEMLGRVAEALQVEPWQLLVEGFDAERPPGLAARGAGSAEARGRVTLEAAIERVATLLLELSGPDRDAANAALHNLPHKPEIWSAIAQTLSRLATPAESGESPESPGKARRSNGK